MNPVPKDNLDTLSQLFIGQLLKGDFSEATIQFDDRMKKTISETKLQQSWEDVTNESGILLQLTPTRSSNNDGYRIIVIKCRFQRFDVDVQLVFNEQGKISGLNFTPIKNIYNPPSYVNKSSFNDVAIEVGEGEWALPGILSIPVGLDQFPGVVLVHGSGPNDMDESIGPNKIFRDLAWGLASQGICVLRYDKMTFKHGKQLTPEMVEKMTVKEEVIDDALIALKLIRKTDNIDTKHIFLLGHSLGATVAPRIGLEDPDLAGLIIMAGLTRSLEDTLLDQYTYIYNLKGAITEQQKAELESLKEKVDKLKDPKYKDKIAAQDLPLGVPIAYWRDLQENMPLDVVKEIDMPMLILQGERDYQVLNSVDFIGWKTALKERSNVNFKLFPELNHLFIKGKGKSTPEEYNVEGHIDDEVITTIVQFIKEL
ncbi:alpha/beta fold hydrolase [Methanobacterium sp.]|uniref:alpha/beta fold hydrolase n=1 Tax=Methanobacterium sp. TaxID=2164 RepID=UPI003C7638A2